MKKTKEQISYNMQRVKSKDSKIELLLRKELWARGIRYRKNVTRIYGKPDIVFIGKKVAVINLIGRVFMQPANCPFLTANNLISSIDADIFIVDFHAEATSEKQALGWYLDGRAACVFGTHTHTQTADERILPGKTAYITDVGMTGPYNSVLGIKKEIAVKKFLTMMNQRYETAEGNCMLNAVIVSVGENNLATDIKRINIR